MSSVLTVHSKNRDDSIWTDTLCFLVKWKYQCISALEMDSLTDRESAAAAIFLL